MPLVTGHAARRYTLASGTVILRRSNPAGVTTYLEGPPGVHRTPNKLFDTSPRVRPLVGLLEAGASRVGALWQAREYFVGGLRLIVKAFWQASLVS